MRDRRRSGPVRSPRIELARLIPSAFFRLGITDLFCKLRELLVGRLLFVQRFMQQLPWIDSKAIAMAIEYEAPLRVATDVPRNARNTGTEQEGKRHYQNAEIPAIPCAPNARASRQSVRVMPPSA